MSMFLLIKLSINSRTRGKPVIFGKKLLLDERASVGLDLFALSLDLLFGEKHGHELDATFPDLAANVFVSIP